MKLYYYKSKKVKWKWFFTTTKAEKRSVNGFVEVDQLCFMRKAIKYRGFYGHFSYTHIEEMLINLALKNDESLNLIRIGI